MCNIVKLDDDTKASIANPTLDNLCTWLHAAVLSVQRKLVVRSFRDCGISLAPDGSENNHLHKQLKAILPTTPVIPLPSTDDIPTIVQCRQIRTGKNSTKFKGKPITCGKCGKPLYANSTKEHIEKCNFLNNVLWKPTISIQIFDFK